MLLHASEPAQGWAALAKILCDRRFSVGSDGLVVAEQRGDDLWMRMWNPDGSEAEMCGNGLRCFGAYAVAQELVSGSDFEVVTKAGRHQISVGAKDLVSCTMGEPTLLAADLDLAPLPLKGTSVSMGNPHLVVEGDPALAARLGAQLEKHPLFPNRTNVHFARVINGQIEMATWERGAGLTLACGTGACATAFALRRQVTLPVRVNVPGGWVEIDSSGNDYVLRGPVETVFTGAIEA